MATKRVADLTIGDVLPVVGTRTVSSFQRDATSVTVRFADGTSQTWQLEGDPSVEVVDA